ncbi:MAG: 3-phosphoshikimate 1-carboxyvinyltransferase [Desulfovibrio sp.]|jgi:3-phosphoshikimate 1-carboxyvinyltransferase|nr:3-phosphoshikimate 1-carboxyvinyltransferase [Desulfovibrio sp.]
MHDSIISVTAPSSKSASHRYLIGAALARGISRVRHPLESQDLERTRAILCAAGASMTPLPDNDGWEIRGMPAPIGGLDEAHALSCDVHESGTTCRLLTAVLAAGQGFFRVHGAERMHKRPIGDLAQALARLGAKIRFEGEPDCPPLLLHARGLGPPHGEDRIQISMDVSSQYFSGLLMAAPLSSAPLLLELSGDKAISWPYVGLTLQCLEDFGIKTRVETRAHTEAPWEEHDARSLRAIAEAVPGCLRVTMRPASYRAGDYCVEGDWSGASYLLAAGALGRVPVRVEGLRRDSLQGDRVFLDILKNMGAHVNVAPNAVSVFPSNLHAADIDMGPCPDLAPTVAVLAAFAQGTSRLYNAAHLRVKESDRIAAPVTELRKAGIAAEERSDGLIVYGAYPRRPRLANNAVLSTHNDHRIAMSLALLGLDEADNPASIAARMDDPKVVAKSFPRFWDIWRQIR